MKEYYNSKDHLIILAVMKYTLTFQFRNAEIDYGWVFMRGLGTQADIRKAGLRKRDIKAGTQKAGSKMVGIQKADKKIKMVLLDYFFFLLVLMNLLLAAIIDCQVCSLTYHYFSIGITTNYNWYNWYKLAWPLISTYSKTHFNILHNPLNWPVWLDRKDYSNTLHSS